MRKLLITASYMLLALKLIFTPALASSDGDYKESVQMQQYEEDDLSVFELVLILAAVVGLSYWLRYK